MSNGFAASGLRDVDLLRDVDWRGAVSLETGDDSSVQPWRVPHDHRALFDVGDLLLRARMPSGARIALRTDSRRLVVVLGAAAGSSPVDVVVDGRVHRGPSTDGPVLVELPAGPSDVEVWLPQFGPVRVQALRVDQGSRCHPVTSADARWTVHGSSITQRRHAAGPVDTWPALVARRLGLDLLNLGFGGQCLLDPMVARLVRDTPADVITLCLGINVFGQATHDERSLLPAVLGFVATVRDGHPSTPITVVSPLATSVPADERNSAGMTLNDVRSHVVLAVQRLVASGDEDLHLVDGHDLLGPEERGHLVDRVHPGASADELVAGRVMPLVLRQLGARS